MHEPSKASFAPADPDALQPGERRPEDPHPSPSPPQGPHPCPKPSRFPDPAPDYSNVVSNPAVASALPLPGRPDRPLKVDLHTHMLPERWPDLAERFGYGRWPSLRLSGNGCGQIYVGDRHFRDVDHRCWAAQVRLADCERHGVDLQVLSTVPVMFSYWARPRDALELARILNDHLASVVRDHPDRFVALGTVPMQDAELAAEELERCMRDLGMPGVQIGSHVNGQNLDDERLFPFFERAAELGAAIFVHPWDMLGGERLERYFMPWLVGMPAETAVAICSLVFGGVLDRLPTLRVAFAHGGGSFPMSIGRIDQGWRARPDLCATRIGAPPSSYLRRIYVDSLVHDAEVLRYLIRLLGADRIALGTDYPFPLGEKAPGQLIESMADLDARTRTWLLGGTALEFLGLGSRAAGPERPREAPAQAIAAPGEAGE